MENDTLQGRAEGASPWGRERVRPEDLAGEGRSPSRPEAEGSPSPVWTQGEGRPTLAQLEKELDRERDRNDRRRLLLTALLALVAVAAVAAVAELLFFPVLEIDGTSMEETLYDGDMVLAWKGAAYGRGDIVAFRLGQSTVVKRVIALEGETVDMDGEGNVSVDGEPLSEPYIHNKSLGQCDVSFPCQVPQGRIFVLGDNREASIDSRSRTVGFVREEDVLGKVLMRMWLFWRAGSAG